MKMRATGKHPLDHLDALYRLEYLARLWTWLTGVVGIWSGGHAMSMIVDIPATGETTSSSISFGSINSRSQR